MEKILTIDYHQEAQRLFETLDAPNFRYGQNMFVTASKVRLPWESGMSVGDVAVNGVEALSLESALSRKELAPIISRILAKRVLRGDRVDAWLGTNHRNTTVLVIPAKAGIHTPIAINYSSTSDVIIIALAGSRARIVESVEGSGDVVSNIDIYAAEDASIAHEFISTGANRFCKRQYILEARANVDVTNVVSDASYLRLREYADLEGAEAKFTTKIAGAAADGQCDIMSIVTHNAPRSVSDIRARGVVAGEGKLLWRGLTRINEGKSHCVATQEARILRLGANAEADAVPQLEIHTEDVRCGHAASIGKPDVESLFYLSSRGVSREDAMRAIVAAHLSPMLSDGLREAAEASWESVAEAAVKTV